VGRGGVRRGAAAGGAPRARAPRRAPAAGPPLPHLAPGPVAVLRVGVVRKPPLLGRHCACPLTRGRCRGALREQRSRDAGLLRASTVLPKQRGRLWPPGAAGELEGGAARRGAPPRGARRPPPPPAGLRAASPGEGAFTDPCLPLAIVLRGRRPPSPAAHRPRHQTPPQTPTQTPTTPRAQVGARPAQGAPACERRTSRRRGGRGARSKGARGAGPAAPRAPAATARTLAPAPETARRRGAAPFMLRAARRPTTPRPLPRSKQEPRARAARQSARAAPPPRPGRPASDPAPAPEARARGPRGL
jgi:hypothetical protein